MAVLLDNVRRTQAIRIGAGAALFFLNVWICWRLFFIEYTQHFGSVEPIFFTIAKAIRSRWPDLGWWQMWNTGMPFEYTYQPLLHYLVAATSALIGWKEARAYHFVIATLYSLGPVTLYALALRLTRRVGVSFAAGLLYTFLSPSALLIGKIATDMGGWWLPRRFHTLVQNADGPNVVGLTFVPLAILLLDRALERRTPGSWAVAAIAIGVVPLTNIPATIGLGMALLSYAMALDWKSWSRRWLGIVGASVAGWGLFAPWLPPSGLALMAANVERMNPTGNFSAEKLPYYLALAGGLAIACVALNKLKAPFSLRFAFLFTLITAAVTLLNGWYGVDLIAQADRFHLVMEMAMVLLVAFALPQGIRWTVRRRVAITAVITLACAFQWDQHRYFVRRWAQESDVANRSEFKVARWMAENAHGDRAFVPGSMAFWLNYWTDTPQLKGCCDQNLLLNVLPSALWVIGTDQGAGERAAEISITWFQVLGVHYAAINGPGSNEIYHDIRNPDKFNGKLRELWRDQDDVIYEVPLTSASLAHVVRPSELVSRIPENGVDTQPLEAYRVALMDPGRPQATFEWINAQDAVIRGTLPAGFLFSIQIPYHAGWRASTESGTFVPLSKDAMGFMTVAPQCNGPCEVRLTFRGGTERTLLRTVSVLLWAMLAGILIFSRPEARALSRKLGRS